MNAGFLISTAGGVTIGDVPKQVYDLACALARIHGDVTVARESRGLHLYMASPACLERDGIKELQSRHLAVNADKYYGLGKFARRRGTYDGDVCALCMKTETPFRVSKLLRMPPLEHRVQGLPDGLGKVVITAREKHLIDDGNGHMIPEHPGQVTPINQLSAGHPARDYLVNRNYNLDWLWEQFRCAYCYQELPEDRVSKRFYKTMPEGWKDTPQGRIIFYADVIGVQKGWQARIIDKVENDQLRYFWHPYENQWVLVEVRDDAGKWQLLSQYANHENFEWKPSKYKTARDCARNELVMGLDAAIRWNMDQGRTKDSVGIVCEGPLDAARFGPPAMATLGKFTSDEQAKLLAKHFRRIIYVGDTDLAGRKAASRIKEVLADKVRLIEAKLPEQFKDPGEMTPAEAFEFIIPIL